MEFLLEDIAARDVFNGDAFGGMLGLMGVKLPGIEIGSALSTGPKIADSDLISFACMAAAIAAAPASGETKGCCFGDIEGAASVPSGI